MKSYTGNRYRFLDCLLLDVEHVVKLKVCNLARFIGINQQQGFLCFSIVLINHQSFFQVRPVFGLIPVVF
jgi:hypothetical protein